MKTIIAFAPAALFTATLIAGAFAPAVAGWVLLAAILSPLALPFAE